MHSVHAQVSGQGSRIGHHGIQAARRGDAEPHNHKERERHDTGLNEVGRADCLEPAHDGVAHDNQGGNDHRPHIIHPEQAVEQLAAGRKTRGRVRYKEHHNRQCGNRIEDVALIVEAPGEEIRHRDGTQCA